MFTIMSSLFILFVLMFICIYSDIMMDNMVEFSGKWIYGYMVWLTVFAIAMMIYSLYLLAAFNAKAL